MFMHAEEDSTDVHQVSLPVRVAAEDKHVIAIVLLLLLQVADVEVGVKLLELLEGLVPEHDGKHLLLVEAGVAEALNHAEIN